MCPTTPKLVLKKFEETERENSTLKLFLRKMRVKTLLTPPQAGFEETEGEKTTLIPYPITVSEENEGET